MDRFNYHDNYVPAAQAMFVFFKKFMKGKRQIPEWAILAIILAVALIAVISIVALRQHADESRQVEMLLSRLKGESYHLDALEWQFERKPDPKLLKEAQQVENEIAQTSDELMLLDPGEERLQQLRKAQLEFETNMDENFRLISAGNFEKMEIFDKEKTDPSMDVLNDQIANTSAIYDERAQRAQMESNIGTAIIVISAGMIIGFLILQFQKMRLKAKLIETEQKVLHQSEERYRTIIETAHDLIWTLNNEGNLTFFNKQFEKTSGYKVSDWVGKSFVPLIYQEDLPKVQEAVLKALQGISQSYEARVCVKDGKISTLLVNTIPWYETNRIIGTVSFGRDITERKQMEESLQESLSRTSSMVEAFDGLVYICSKNYEVEFANKHLIERTGFNPVGQKCYKALHDLDNICPWCVNNQVFKGETVRWEVQSPKDNNWYYIINTPIYHTDGSISKMAMIQDISERKRAVEALQQSEEKYHTLIDNIQDGVFIIQDAKIQFANESFARIVGYTVEGVTGKDFHEFVAPEDLEMVADRYRRRQAREDVPREYEFNMMHKDGRTRILINMNVGLITYRGRVASMGTVKDITDKKRLESQLLRTQRMESVGTLAGGIAHDINNVLTPIALSQELLQEKLTDEESKRLLDTIERSTKRGANLMKQIMSFTRGVKGERNAVQVVNLVSEIRQIAKETFPRNIQIRTDIPKDLWIISGDVTQLHQVIMNLCVNARDAMPDGGILSITASNFFIDESYVKMNPEARIGPHIVITISDTGTGIPPEILDRIFEPFFTTKEHGKGTGLGLSTSLGIVKSHGGFINVSSEFGRGTAFKVYLPAITIPETPNEEEEQHELLIGHGEAILVVDDEDQIRETTKKILETHGYKVITASDGKEAIALYSQYRELIKAVLIDMMMPVMDGSSCIRELHKANPELKVIAVSGLAEKDKLAKVDEAHVQTFLSKPYVTGKLLRTIYDIVSTK